MQPITTTFTRESRLKMRRAMKAGLHGTPLGAELAIERFHGRKEGRSGGLKKILRVGGPRHGRKTLVIDPNKKERLGEERKQVRFVGRKRRVDANGRLILGSRHSG